MTAAWRLLTGEGRGAAWTVLALIVVGLASASVGSRWVTLAAVVAGVFVEPWLHTSSIGGVRILRGTGLGITSRSVVRLLTVALLGTQTWTSGHVGAAFAVCSLILLLLLGLTNSLRVRLRLRSTPAIEARGVPLPMPRPVPMWVRSGDGWLRALLELPLLVGGVVAVMSAGPVWVGGILSSAGLATLSWVLFSASERAGDLLGAESLTEHVQSFLNNHRPDVVLYFSGPASSAYQVNMWLATLERVHRRPLVVIRERSVFGALGATVVPVLCVPSPTTLMGIDFADVRVALYPANVGNNIHMLRLPTMMSAFIGHGDSDKNASFNPFSRAYDQIWVAGRAGADRYARAAIGVDARCLIEVGRPQLDGVGSAVPPGDGHVRTVLYAPTWEGWDSAQAYSSVAAIGPTIVRAALASPGSLRLVYKPHPFAGIRDPHIRRAHAEIVRMIRADNEANGRVITAGIDGVHSAVTSGSEGSALDEERRVHDREQKYWGSLAPDTHVVVEPSGPSLYSCFNQADVLITDISSVLSDYLASGRPYAVCNVSGLSPDHFRLAYPSTSAGVVIDADGTGIEDIMTVAADASADDLGSQRMDLATYLLGPPGGTSMARFNEAVDALARSAELRNAQRADESGPGDELNDREPSRPTSGVDASEGAVDSDDGDDLTELRADGDPGDVARE